MFARNEQTTFTMVLNTHFYCWLYKVGHSTVWQSTAKLWVLAATVFNTFVHSAVSYTFLHPDLVQNNNNVKSSYYISPLVTWFVNTWYNGWHKAVLCMYSQLACSCSTFSPKLKNECIMLTIENFPRNLSKYTCISFISANVYCFSLCVVVFSQWFTQYYFVCFNLKRHTCICIRQTTV